MIKISRLTGVFGEKIVSGDGERTLHPFTVMVYKEISDQVRSWRFIILGALIALTCMGSLYTALMNIGKTIKPNDPEGIYFFLKLFTVSDGSFPAYYVFIGFLGPLLGIALGFDAINSEQSGRTLSRILAQPIHRDYVINAKFTASLIVISVMLFSLNLLMMGVGLIMIGIPPTVGEFLRILFFWVLSVVYVGLWLNLSIFFSVRFRQAATSALTSIAVWLFFSVFFQIIINLVSRALSPSPGMASTGQIIRFQKLVLNLSRVNPGQLFNDAATTLLRPSVRTLGPLTLSQVIGAIPSPLSLGQSLMLVWPQLTVLVAATVVCFSLSYVFFMKKEIRSR